MSVAILARAIVHTAAISWPTVFEAAFSRLEQADCDTRLERWSRALLHDADVHLEVSGIERLDPGQSYVVMSNHQSLYDIPVLFQALPLRLRMAAKAELFRVPLWGRAMRAAQFVSIDRKHGAEARKVLLQAGKALQQSGVSLWVAPEGTRSPDGQLLPFKSGAFLLAQALELPIVPVSLQGTRAVLGKQGRHVERGQKVRVHVLPPLPPAGFPTEVEDLKQLVRGLLQTDLDPA